MLRLQRSAGNSRVADLLQRAPDGPAAPAAPESLLVEDAAEPASGQMRRSAFLAELRAGATRTARAAMDGSLEAVGVDAAVEQWMGTLEPLDHRALERRIRDEIPGSRTARDAREYLAQICARIRTEVEQRAGPAAEDGDASAAGSLTGAITSAASSVATGVAGAASSLASMLFKRRDGAGSGAAAAERSELGRGAPLDGATRGRMESALGQDFSDVRVHTGARAAGVASAHGALGFTIGTDVGFAPEQYRPGSTTGDALIAHELAHVMQQRSASGPAGASGVGALEEEADAAALAAVAELDDDHTAPRRSRPSLRSGLQLLSCAPAKAPTDPARQVRVLGQGRARKLLDAKFGTPLSPRLHRGQVRQDPLGGTGRQAGGADPGPRAGRHTVEGCARAVRRPGRLEGRMCAAGPAQPQWARLNTFGDEAFDRETPTIELRGRGSTGVKTRAHYGRNGADAPWFEVADVEPGKEQITLSDRRVPGDTAQLVAAAPIGSRVRWTNSNQRPDEQNRHENAVKMGPGEYAAKPYGVVSAEHIVEKLIEGKLDRPNREELRRMVFIDEIEQFDTP